MAGQHCTRQLRMAMAMWCGHFCKEGPTLMHRTIMEVQRCIERPRWATLVWYACYLRKGPTSTRNIALKLCAIILPSDENGAHLWFGAYEKAKTNVKGTPLHEATRLGHEAVVKLLVEAAGVEINARMRKGRRHFTAQLSTSMRQWPSSFYKEESMSMRVTMVGGCRYT
jgi:hypothetical protein